MQKKDFKKCLNGSKSWISFFQVHKILQSENVCMCTCVYEHNQVGMLMMFSHDKGLNANFILLPHLNRQRHKAYYTSYYHYANTRLTSPNSTSFILSNKLS